MYETISSPINYGGLELKNRIIFAPTTFGLAEDEYFEKIRKIAAGGCAMIIICDVIISPIVSDIDCIILFNCESRNIEIAAFGIEAFFKMFWHASARLGS